jgi:hypothetical protein
MYRMSTTLGRKASGRPYHRPRRRAHLGGKHDHFLYFVFFRRPFAISPKGFYIYIIDFRSRRIRRAKEIVKRAHRVESGSHYASMKWGRVVHPLFLLVRFHIDFFRSSNVYP